MSAVLHAIIDVFVNLDEHLGAVITQYGTATYALLFVIIFCETGLVVTPFLPGDSLLFAVGAFAALGSLNLWLAMGLLFVAAVVGDAVNYAVGSRAASAAALTRLLKPEHLAKTTAFYAKHGPKTIVLARFVPIVRTLAPFVAGVGGMPYRLFAAYNLLGAALWVGSMTLAGYFFGNMPWVREHFEAVVLGIIAVSLLPVIIEAVRGRMHAAAPQEEKSDRQAAAFLVTR